MDYVKMISMPVTSPDMVVAWCRMLVNAPRSNVYFFCQTAKIPTLPFAGFICRISRVIRRGAVCQHGLTWQVRESAL